jgi:hypothetical protein
MWVALHLLGRAEYRLGHFEAAAQAESGALQARTDWGYGAVQDQRDLAEMSTWRALALVRQGKNAEAVATIDPVLKFERSLAQRNRGDQWVAFELARALYVKALTDPKRAPPILSEAGAWLNKLPAAIGTLSEVKLWRGWIQQASKGGG